MRFAANPAHWETDWNGILSLCVAGFLGIVVGVASAKTAVVSIRQMARLDEVRLLRPDAAVAVTPYTLAALDPPRPGSDGLPDMSVPWGDD